MVKNSVNAMLVVLLSKNTFRNFVKITLCLFWALKKSRLPILNSFPKKSATSLH